MDRRWAKRGLTSNTLEPSNGDIDQHAPLPSSEPILTQARDLVDVDLGLDALPAHLLVGQTAGGALGVVLDRRRDVLERAEGNLGGRLGEIVEWVDEDVSWSTCMVHKVG